jgi:hypothetical protein
LKGVLPMESTSDVVRLGVSFFMASIVIYGAE